jgi:hypothetical protein
MLMDHYLKANDFEKAALAAHEVLLQEYADNELTLTACLLSCLKYLKSKPNYLNEPIENDNESGEKVKKNYKPWYIFRSKIVY